MLLDSVCRQKTRSQAYSRLYIYMVTSTRLQDCLGCMTANIDSTGHLIMMHTPIHNHAYINTKSTESCLACLPETFHYRSRTHTNAIRTCDDSSTVSPKLSFVATISMGVVLTACMDSPKGQPAERNQCPDWFASGNTTLLMAFSVTHPLLRRMLGYIDDSQLHY